VGEPVEGNARRSCAPGATGVVIDAGGALRGRGWKGGGWWLVGGDSRHGGGGAKFASAESLSAGVDTHVEKAQEVVKTL
jgi:hypothetical protein